MHKSIQKVLMTNSVWSGSAGYGWKLKYYMSKYDVLDDDSSTITTKAEKNMNFNSELDRVRYFWNVNFVKNGMKFQHFS